MKEFRFYVLLALSVLGVVWLGVSAQAQQPQMQDYLAVTVSAADTSANLATLIQTKLGWSAAQLQQNWREVTIQVDPETCTSAVVRIGSYNLGVTLGGAVQKGATLACGQSLTVRNNVSNVLLPSVYVQTVGGPQVINIQAWK